MDIDQFVKAFEPTFKGGYGKLAGKVALLAAPHSKPLTALAQSTTKPTTGPVMVSSSQETALQRILATTTMDASVKIDNSDLGNFGPIAFLYNAMHLGGGPRTPTGHGTVAVHMEMGKLHVSRLYYFNRGIEVNGVATIDQLWNLPDCPLSGSASGTARPLKNIRLPLFAEADALLSSLQGTLTNIMFDNTLRNRATSRSSASPNSAANCAACSWANWAEDSNRRNFHASALAR